MKNKQFKVIMLCEYFFPFDRGGSEWSVYYLAQDLIKRKHIVSVFTPNYGTDSQSELDSIQIERFPFIKLKNKYDSVTPFLFTNLLWQLKTVWHLYQYCLSFKPTHLHVQSKYFLPTAISVGKIFKIPVITTIRDYILLCPYAYCINHENSYQACNLLEVITQDLKLLRQNHFQKYIPIISELSAIYGWLNTHFLRNFLKQSAAIIGISEKLTKIYQKNDIKIDETIYNTFILPKIKNQKSKNYILYAGRLTKGKGVDLLIEAYTQLIKNHKLPNLIIAGDGPLREKIKKTKNITWLKHVPYAELITKIRSAIFVVVPSVWEEPFGRIALEAIALDTPVLASNRGALPEIVKKTSGGLIVEPTIEGLAIGLLEMLEKHSQFKSRIKKKAIQKIFQHDPVLKYESLYKKLQ